MENPLAKLREDIRGDVREDMTALYFKADIERRRLVIWVEAQTLMKLDPTRAESEYGPISHLLKP